MQSLRTLLLATLLPLSMSIAIAAGDSTLERGFQVMEQAEDEASYMQGARQIIEQGPSALPALTQRLIDADDDEQRVVITFLIASIQGPAAMAGGTTELPPELIAAVTRLMAETRTPELQINLANIAGNMSPHPESIVKGLLSILSNTEHPDIRATTSAAIAMRSGPEALPLMHEALRQSDSDRFSGDLAAILRGTELPADVLPVLQALLTSDNAEARQAASRTLDEAGEHDPAQLDAALRDLEQAQTDMQLITAALAVGRHTDSSERVAQALTTALGKARRIEERMEIIRSLAASGEPGLDRIYATLRATDDPELLRHYIMGINSARIVRDNPRTLAVLMELAARDDNPDLADMAAFGLNSQRQAAVTAIDETLADSSISEATRKRLQSVRERLTR